MSKISFNYEVELEVLDEVKLEGWIKDTIRNEKCVLGEISYVFCTDPYLHALNVEFLNHDTLTDIISFDYSLGRNVSGDIYISIDRVTENSIVYDVAFMEELHRVMIHGVLHYCGYKDKTNDEVEEMRAKEDYYLTRLQMIE